jgi:D-alanyl-D-alanine dipeptidase
MTNHSASCGSTCCHLRLPEPWLSNQTPKMRPYKISVLLVAEVAAMVSTDANASGPFVDVRSVDPTIMVELRYAGPNNFLGHSLYPAGTRALARPEVASALAVAQNILRRYQYGLKIWDAYRPVAVQAKLWQASLNSHYVANPEFGAGSLHSLGIAVDATTR